MKPTDEDRKNSDFGPSEAENKDRGKTKYDKPATSGEDTATDERRDKPLRGPEPYDGD